MALKSDSFFLNLFQTCRFAPHESIPTWTGQTIDLVPTAENIVSICEMQVQCVLYSVCVHVWYMCTCLIDLLYMTLCMWCILMRSYVFVYLMNCAILQILYYYVRMFMLYSKWWSDCCHFITVRFFLIKVEGIKMIVLDSQQLDECRNTFFRSTGNVVEIDNDKTSSHQSVAERISDLKVTGYKLVIFIHVYLNTLEHVSVFCITPVVLVHSTCWVPNC